MNEILENIQENMGEENLSASCEENDCIASLEDVPMPRVVVDVNKAFPAHRIEGKRCDYIVFFMNAAEDRLVTVPIELKGGSVDASEVSEQLQGGSDFANRLAPRKCGTIFRPILIHGRGIHKNQKKGLNRAKIRFRGTNSTIETTHCDEPKNLANVLSK